jgi:hypothetical protein
LNLHGHVEGRDEAIEGQKNIPPRRFHPLAMMDACGCWIQPAAQCVNHKLSTRSSWVVATSRKRKLIIQVAGEYISGRGNQKVSAESNSLRDTLSLDCSGSIYISLFSSDAAAAALYPFGDGRLSGRPSGAT